MTENTWTVFEETRNQWTKETTYTHYPDSIGTALSWFFYVNGIRGNAEKFYHFLLGFVGEEHIDKGKEYGSLFFRKDGARAIELQKYEGCQGFHDDKTTTIIVNIVPASADGLPLQAFPISMEPPAEWVPLDRSKPNRWNDRFSKCGSVMVCPQKNMETWIPDYRRSCSYFVNDMPGCPGWFLLEYKVERD